MLMNRTPSWLSVIACLGLQVGIAAADTPVSPAAPQPARSASAPKYVLPEGITEEMLAPPPVPRFMLERPARPLTTDEMVQQVHEAEARAKPAQRTAIQPASRPVSSPASR